MHLHYTTYPRLNQELLFTLEKCKIFFGLILKIYSMKSNMPLCGVNKKKSNNNFIKTFLFPLSISVLYKFLWPSFLVRDFDWVPVSLIFSCLFLPPRHHLQWTPQLLVAVVQRSLFLNLHTQLFSISEKKIQINKELNWNHQGTFDSAPSLGSHASSVLSTRNSN